MHNSSRCLSHVVSCHILALCLKSSILISNTIWYHINWWSMGAFFPSGNFVGYCMCPQCIAILDIQGQSLIHSLRESMPNLWYFFRYLFCHLFTLAIILSIFLSMCLTNQLKTVSWSIPCTIANSAVYTGWDSFNLDSFLQEVKPSFHWQQICQPAVDLWINDMPCI